MNAQPNEAIALELRRLYLRDGVLLPRVVVTEARDPDHVLHDHFEWDDALAADAHRLWQARQIIRSVTIEVETTPDRTITVNAWTHPPAGVGYLDTRDALGRAETHDLVLSELQRAIVALRRKFDALIDVDAVWASMTSTSATV